MTFSRVGYISAAGLGVLFLLNQVDELFSTASLSSPEDLSLVLVCLSTHLSHLLLSLILFIKGLAKMADIEGCVITVFVSAYWHLVEVVCGMK